MAEFYLGAPEPAWANRTTVPLMISHNRLRRLKYMRPATAPLWIDSGVFGDLVLAGREPDPPKVYAQALNRYADMGTARYASPQDRMCESIALRRSGLTIPDHQRLTVQNFVDLRSLQPRIPIVPVLQGYAEADYMRCVDLYQEAGVNLWAEPVVGVGSICRRHNTTEIRGLLQKLHGIGLRLHAFGLKTNAWALSHQYLVSADSQAAFYAARMRKLRMPGCAHPGPCSYCLPFALAWRAKHVGTLDTTHASLFDFG